MKQRTSQLVLHASLRAIVLATLLGLFAPTLFAAACSGLPTEAQLKAFLAKAAAGTGISPPLGPGTGVGGLFGGQRMWAAVVNRNGVICAYVTSPPILHRPGREASRSQRQRHTLPMRSVWTRWPSQPPAFTPSFNRGIRFLV
jgi:hypothetical protein